MKSVLLIAALSLFAFTAAARAETAATQPADGNTAVKDGLSVTVEFLSATLAADAPIKFSVIFKNVSDKAFNLWDAGNFWDWKIQFFGEQRQGPWQLKPLFETDRDPQEMTLKPGETYVVPVDLTPKDDQDYEFTWEGIQKDRVAPVKQLPAGKYHLELSITLGTFPYGNRASTLPLWAGQIQTKPVQVEITPAKKP